MTITEAYNNIGQPFKLIAYTGGILGDFDTIKKVEADGTIHGEYLEANCNDCRLKQPVPEGFKRLTDEA